MPKEQQDSGVALTYKAIFGLLTTLLLGLVGWVFMDLHSNVGTIQSDVVEIKQEVTAIKVRQEIMSDDIEEIKNED